MSAATEAPPEEEPEVVVEPEAEQPKAKKGIWKRTKDLVATVGTKTKAGSKKVWNATKSAAKHAWSATKWVGWVVTVGVGWLGTALFSAIGFVVTVVATVSVAIVFGILLLLGIILAVIAFAFMSVGFFYNKYVLGTFRYFKSRGNEEERMKYPTMKDWFGFRQWFSGQEGTRGTYQDFASHWWGRFLNDEGDIVVPKSKAEEESNWPYWNEDGTPDMRHWHAGLDPWPWKSRERSDVELDERVLAMIEEDLADPEHAFPDAEVWKIDEEGETYDIVPEGYFEEIEGDDSQWDYSTYDNLDDLVDLYTYKMSRSRQQNNMPRCHYWEGRLRMLMSYRTDENRLGRPGMVWALIYNQLRHQRSPRAMWYIRAGFKDEVESLQRRQQRLTNLAEAG